MHSLSLHTAPQCTPDFPSGPAHLGHILGTSAGFLFPLLQPLAPPADPGQKKTVSTCCEETEPREATGTTGCRAHGRPNSAPRAVVPCRRQRQGCGGGASGMWASAGSCPSQHLHLLLRLPQAQTHPGCWQRPIQSRARACISFPVSLCSHLQPMFSFQILTSLFFPSLRDPTITSSFLF